MRSSGRRWRLLGRADLVAARRGDIQAALIRAWREPRFGTGRNFSGVSPADSAEADWCALELMRRAGKPPEIDLAQLHTYLRGASQGGFYFLFPMNWHRRFERLTLYRLERDWPQLQAGIRGIAIDWQGAIALLCISLFSVLVLLRAPPSPEERVDRVFD